MSCVNSDANGLLQNLILESIYPVQIPPLACTLARTLEPPLCRTARLFTHVSPVFPKLFTLNKPRMDQRKCRVHPKLCSVVQCCNLQYFMQYIELKSDRKMAVVYIGLVYGKRGFLALLGPVGKPTHLESSKLDKIRLRYSQICALDALQHFGRAGLGCWARILGIVE